MVNTRPGPTRTTRLQLRARHGPRAPRDLATAKHTEPRLYRALTAARHTTARPASPNPPPPTRRWCDGLPNPSPAAAQRAAINLHVHCRRSSSARPTDHGSPWYPTHSTASESLPRALSRPTLRGVPRKLAGRTSPDHLARPGTSLLPTRIHCQGRTARQPVPSNSAPWMLQKPGRSGDSDTS
jgi:hypothetical protein